MSHTQTGSAPGSGPLDRSRVPEAGPLRPFHFPPIERATLSNGLPLLIAETDGLPVVTVSLILPAGGVHEAPERAGLASLTSALLESGAGGRGAAEIADALEALGVQLGVGTSWDVAHVEITGLRSRLEPALAILTDLVRAPTFPQDEVERIQKEQLAAILQRRAEPRGLANEMAARFIFSEDTPFARPLSGTTRTLESLTRSDVAGFHRARYTPVGATLVVAGAIRPDEAERIASAALADWAGAAPEPVTVAVEPRSRAGQLVVVHRPGSVQSEIRVGQVGVARPHPDYFPLVVMNAILGGAFTSRLNMNLRERQGFTYGVSSTFAMRRHPGPFLVSTAVQTEVTAAALTEIMREVRGIRDEPVREQELVDARSYIAGTFPLRLQTTEGVASRLAEMAMYDLPSDYFDHYRDRIVAVDGDEVHRVAREHLDPDAMAVVVVGDADKIRPELEALGMGEVRVVNPTEVE